MARGILAVAFNCANAHEDEFHDWYDLEHIPERERVPGFGLCERYIDLANPKQAVAIYDLDSIDVLNTPAYAAIGGDNLSVWSKRVTAMCDRMLRFEGTQISPGDAKAPAGAGDAKSPAGAGGLVLVSMVIAPDVAQDFNAWYDTEHIPALTAVPGVMASRRYKAPAAEAKGTRYTAIYHLTGTDVLETEAWQTAATSPWTERMFPHFQDFVWIRARRYVRGA